VLIADAPILIALAKMRRLDLLHSVYGDVMIGPRVRVETVDGGKGILVPGVAHIEKAMDDGWFQVARPSSKEKSTAHGIVSKAGLDAGQADSLASAGSSKVMIILDDSTARLFAEVMGARSLELPECCSRHSGKSI
jgi:predicted nucleic acid-binding protein